MNDGRWKALNDFTHEEIPWSGKREPLTPSTRILHDLRIDGDDAIEFIDKLFEKFDIKGEFPYARYFSGEGTASAALFLVPALVGALFRVIFKRRSNPVPEDHPLTLGMLLEAMRIGRWDTEGIERSQTAE